ncbi:MAG TPA: hypothetical protein PLP05_00385 [Sedimentisphaerales bacterium]|nr:hypothetical protein [Sedimentisphaerales bacterium]
MKNLIITTAVIAAIILLDILLFFIGIIVFVGQMAEATCDVLEEKIFKMTRYIEKWR